MSDKLLKVLISDKLTKSAEAALKASNGIEVEVRTGLSEAELIAIIGDYHGLLIRSATKVTEDVLAAADNLRVIGRAGIGVDNVDVKTASAKGIVVMNTPGGNTVTTAEHTVSMMMSLARKIPQATASMKAGKWEKNKFSGIELSGKTLGIVGIGRIGAIVADRAHGLKMKVVAYDPYLSHDAAEKIGVELLSLDDVYKRADVISIHTPMTPETRGMINGAAFDKMKDGVRIVNCARGGIIDEAALATAIKDGKVAGAALDVLEVEPPGADHPLLGLDEMIITPHLGASTGEALENVSIAVAEQARDYLLSGVIRNAVNVPAVAEEEMATLKPYLDLSEQLGSFLSQLAEGALEKIEITLMGDLAEKDDQPIVRAVVKGALETYVGKTVNYVNAPMLAAERGVEVVTSTTSGRRNFSSLISVKVVTDKDQRCAEGTVFIGGQPRLVRLEDYLLEAKLSGSMLVFSNLDQPGAIGRIGSAIGAKNINIAAFQLGRVKEEGIAVAIINIDSEPTAEDMAEFSNLESVLSVRKVLL